MSGLSELYQTDYSAWALRQAELLRSGHYAELDIDHLLQELSDLSKSDRRELESRLLILIAHLLKWQFQYQTLSERWREFDGRSWRATIIEQRKQLAVLLRQSPGLKSILTEAIGSTYPDAVDLTSKKRDCRRKPSQRNALTAGNNCWTTTGIPTPPDHVNSHFLLRP